MANPAAVGLETPGRLKLCAWLDDPEHKQTALALALHINQSSVSLWVRGRSRPESHLRECLSLLLKIAPWEWDTEAERALVEEVRAKVEPSPVPASRKRSGTTRAVTTPKAHTA